MHMDLEYWQMQVSAGKAWLALHCFPCIAISSLALHCVPCISLQFLLLHCIIFLGVSTVSASFASPVASRLQFKCFAWFCGEKPAFAVQPLMFQHCFEWYCPSTYILPHAFKKNCESLQKPWYCGWVYRWNISVQYYRVYIVDCTHIHTYIYIYIYIYVHMYIYARC